jgi:toxin ParE1/3/4
VARKVAWTETAWQDIEDAANYIAKDSPHYAASFIREARDAARSLSQLAERGRVVPEFNNINVRELFVGSYRLLYQLTAQNVYIIGFIHGARDLLALWERENRP